MNTPSPRNPLAGLTLGVAVIGIEGLVISPVLADIGQTFQVSPGLAAWAVAIYGLTLAVVAPLVALLGHRSSRRTTMLAGMGLVVCAGLLCAWSPRFWVLLLGRAACGAGAGAYLPACYAYVGDTTAYAARGRAMGRVMAGWSVALVVGVPFGAVVAQYQGWRATFFLVSVAGLIAVVHVVRLNRVAPVPRLPALSVLARGVPLLLCVNFFNVLSFYGVYTFLGVVTRQRLALGSAGFGALVSCYGAGLMCSTLNARLLDRWGKERTLTVGLSVLVLQLSLLGPATAHWSTLAMAMLLWGVSQGFVQTATATLVTQASGNARGLAMALMSCGSYLAVGVGSLAGGWLLEGFGFRSLSLACAGAAFSALLLLRRYVGRFAAGP